MRQKLRLLDAYCGVGGASRGYQTVGFHVTGVDIVPQPNYIGDVFVQGDAVDFIRSHGHDFDAIHASPPCQAACSLTKGTNRNLERGYPQLISATRGVLVDTGRPWVIENVVGAPVRRDLLLCGEMFDLGVIRHRLFETSWWSLMQPHHRRHRGRVSGMNHGQWFVGPYMQVYGNGGGKGTIAQWQAAMGIDWTDVRREIAEAIPPVYAEYVGAFLVDTVHLSDTKRRTSSATDLRASQG